MTHQEWDTEGIIRLLSTPGDWLTHTAADADWENAFGARRTGRDEIDAFLAEHVRPTMRDAERTVLEHRIRFITDDLAVADQYWRLTAQRGPDGQPRPERNGRTTFVLQRGSGAWSIVLQRIADLRSVEGRERSGPQATPWAVVLSGPTSSGKTSVAVALQQRLSTPTRPFLHLEADRAYPHVPDAFDSSALGLQAGHAFHQSIAAYLDCGFDVIVDGALPYGDEPGLQDALSIYRQFRLCLVGVRCEVPELERRERARGDRVQGWARQQAADLHDGMTYDVEVDTTATSPDECAVIIARHLDTLDDRLRNERA